MVKKDNHIRYRACRKKKLRFATYNEAMKAAKRIRENTGEVLYPYECWVCGGWHLSRQDWDGDKE